VGGMGHHFGTGCSVVFPMSPLMFHCIFYVAPAGEIVCVGEVFQYTPKKLKWIGYILAKTSGADITGNLMR